MQSNPTPTVPAKQPASPIRVCLYSGCTKQLRSDNKSGYCTLHKDFSRPHLNAGPQICKEPGCTTPLRPKSRTDYCRRHYLKALTAPQLYGEDLEARRADDRWEERNGETNTVACRICGKRRECLGSKGKRNHFLEEHELTVPEYRQHCKNQGWGTPPIRSLKGHKAIAEWHHNNPDKVKAMGRTKNAKDKVRRATDPEFRKHEGDQIRKLAQSKLTEDEKQNRVQCLVPDPSSGLPCGEWYRSLGAHLYAVHKISFAEYHLLRPGAPTEAPDLVGQGSKVGQFSKQWWAEQKRKLADAEAAKAEVERLAQRLAWRPKGFDKWPAEDQMVGLMLIENPTLSNREIGQRLDDKSRLKCPFGGTWERSLTTPGTGANRISFIRTALQKRPAA